MDKIGSVTPTPGSIHRMLLLFFLHKKTSPLTQTWPLCVSVCCIWGLPGLLASGFVGCHRDPCHLQEIQFNKSFTFCFTLLIFLNNTPYYCILYAMMEWRKLAKLPPPLLMWWVWIKIKLCFVKICCIEIGIFTLHNVGCEAFLVTPFLSFFVIWCQIRRMGLSWKKGHQDSPQECQMTVRLTGYDC